MSEHTSKRFWEVDTLRGVAIIMMVLVHLRYDLVYYGGYRAALLVAPFWPNFARTTASIFMFLVGVSLTLSYSRAKGDSQGHSPLFPKYLKRGLIVFGWGMVITLVTWLLLREGAVFFGILHFIGVSIILAYPFLRLRFPSLLAGVVLIVIGGYLSRQTFAFSWLLWLGFVPERLAGVDYYPLLPWFGVVLIGVFAGQMLYCGSTRRIALPDWSRVLPIRWLGFMGRHSLLIYLVHQPLIIAVLSLAGIINLGFT